MSCLWLVYAEFSPFNHVAKMMYSEVDCQQLPVEVTGMGFSGFEK